MSEPPARPSDPGPATEVPVGSAVEVLRVAGHLGLTSFGGPIAHLGYFHREYVERRGWLDEATYADLVALCQSLPGPASSQLGIAIGTLRAGIRGGLAAWFGFTLPSVVVLVAFGLLANSADLSQAGWVHGLKLAAVAVVAQAVWLMARSLTPDWPRRAMAIVAAGLSLAWASAFSQVAIILGGALVGWLVLRPGVAARAGSDLRVVPRRFGIAALGLFTGLLLGLPLLNGAGGHPLEFFEGFYRSGALVFGGGHLVLPLLHTRVVDPGWVTNDQFLAGYGAAQVVPGPLFSFSAYLGTVEGPAPNGIVGALIAVVGIFLPGILLIFGTLPFWAMLRGSIPFGRALAGTNAAVVGILLAALYTPVWTSAVGSAADVAVAAGALGLLLTRRVPPIVVVVFAAAAGQVLVAV